MQNVVLISTWLLVALFSTELMSQEKAVAPVKTTDLSSATKSDSIKKPQEKATEEEDDSSVNSEEFKAKLGQMYIRVNKSIELIRQQITENQSAPFLANLYMQLGDLLSQKSTVVYYVKMEGSNGDKGDQSTQEKKFKDVVDITKEAISIYEKVLVEFPKYAGRSRVLYALSLTTKSIDEKVKFLTYVNQLMKEFPGTQEAVKGQMLLAQHTYDNGIYDESFKLYSPVSTSKFEYERNLARYKMGLIFLIDGKHKEALDAFEKVVTDKELKEKNDEMELSLESRSVKSNLKREALVDSIRAYTEVYKENAEAVKYYSNIAPTESLFREVIEKLSFRYIKLKRYSEAIKLLRTLSERTASPEQVINIYKEVLLMIPLNDRVSLPTSEIRYVLEKYLQWKAFYTIPAKAKDSSADFFEKQLRDLGTRCHDLGKNPKEPKKVELLKKSVEYYEMYFAAFPQSPFYAKMAMNMGDAYFRQNDFLKCGDFYLRVFKGEFGKTEFKDLSLKNAVYCLEKDREYSFYELRRVKGLLIESLTLLMKHDKSKSNDPKTHFALAKANYDQGFYNQALDKLMNFMKKYPNTPYAIDSANLILDYFNIKSDYNNLIIWGNKILSLNLPNKELNAKVAQIKEQAKLKKLQSQVESSASFDGFAQGKSYLANAANIQNVELRNLALQKALEASKREKDIDTFLKSAQLIAGKEKDPSKRYEIESSIASEHLKMGNFQEAYGYYKKIFTENGYTAQQKQDAYNQAISLLTATRDWENLASMTNNSSLWRSLPDNYKTQLQEQVTNLLESPIEIPGSLANLIQSMRPSATLSLGLFKAQRKLKGSLQSYAQSAIRSTCGTSGSENVCRWTKVSAIDKLSNTVKQQLSSPPKSLQEMESTANAFAGATEKYIALEGGGDAHLDMLTSLRLGELYKMFGRFLKLTADRNPSIKPVLEAKANESMSSGQNFIARCGKIIESSKMLTPVNRYCQSGSNPSLSQAITWSKSYPAFGLRRVPFSKYIDMKKNLFSSFTSSNALKLAKQFYDNQEYHFATAMSVYGMSADAQEAGRLNTILGCSVLNLGYFSEASFYLDKGEEYDGLRSKCLGLIKSVAQ